MKAMILSAGRGERLRPLTDYFPKPLLPIKGIPLIGYHLMALAACGITEVVINVSYMAKQLCEALRDGGDYGVKLYYSVEPVALETGGGICHALPLLGEDPFMVINGDIWTDYPFKELPTSPEGLGHIILAANPAHNPQGDFGLEAQQVTLDSDTRFTFTGIGVYRPQLFSHQPAGSLRLADILKQAITQQQLSGERYLGTWLDIGSVSRLAMLADLPKSAVIKKTSR